MSAGQSLFGRELEPVEHRARWLAWGLAVQAIGAALPVAAALSRAHRDGLGGTVTRYTVRLVWHEMLHSRADIALIVLGVVIFAAGGMVLARPFVRSPLMLFVATPLAAAVGVIVLGLVALIIAALIALAESSGADSGLDALFSSSGSTRRKRDEDART